MPFPLEEKAGGIARIPNVAGNNYIERLANRWNYAVDVYLNHQEDFILMRYEDFCLNKADEIANLARKVGLNPVNNITACLNKKYQPQGDHSISHVKFFRTLNLYRLETICKERMNHFGYKVLE